MGLGWIVICAPDQVEGALAAGPGGTVVGTITGSRGVKVRVAGE